MANERGRIPPSFQSLQVNCCKNPNCSNYCVPARDFGSDPCYTVVSSGKNTPVLSCKGCGEHPPIKSNRAIMEEFARMIAPLVMKTDVGCPDEDCENHDVPAGTRGAYHRWTSTSISPRYRCCKCRHVFTVTTRPPLSAIDAWKDEYVYRSLINKVPMRRVSKIMKVSIGKTYACLRRFSDQTRKFGAEQERALLNGQPLPSLQIHLDAQDYVLNWSHADNTRNIQLRALGSCDGPTGYVFGMHLNFDSSLDAPTVEDNALEIGDLELPPPHRRWARLWLNDDYTNSLKLHRRRKGSPEPKKDFKTRRNVVMQKVQDTYADTANRTDVEAVEEHDQDSQLPSKGMQVHVEYVSYAHLRYLDLLTANAPRVDLYMDQESGIRAAYLHAFRDRIVAGESDGFYVSINKEYQQNDREELAAEVKKTLQTRMLATGKSEHEVRIEMIKEQLPKMYAIGRWQDRWLEHPFPSMAEPEKAVCHLTRDVIGRNEPAIDDLAMQYDAASLHSIDRFFQQVRRSISLLERPIATSSSKRRVWYGYSSYSPEIVMALLEMLRVHYNFCQPGRDGETPAMRLGLVDRVFDETEIVDFMPMVGMDFARAA